MPVSTHGGSIRYGAVYAAVYLGTGIATPYMPTWFRSNGLDGMQIGVVLALPMLGRIVTGPLIALWADGFRERRTPILLLLLTAAAAFTLLLPASSVPVVAFLWFVAATSISGVSPLIDVVVLRRAAGERFTYAVPRGIGSAAYVAGNVGVGLLLVPYGAAIAVIGSAAAALLSAVAVRLLLPADAVHEGDAPGLRERTAAFRALFSDRRLMLIILAAGLIQGANAFYFSFSTLISRAQGVGSGTIGLLWGLGVACEVAFLWFGEPWRRKIGPERMLMVAAAASIVRWLLLAMAPPLWALWLLQALHALTLSAPFIAALQLIDRMTPRGSASAAQQVNAAFSSGLVMGCATLLGGALYDEVGSLVYLLMALMAALGLAAWTAQRRLKSDQPAALALVRTPG
ncbi:MFS transporter [Sphingopyxis sp.]|uniref:MFS transporter n=1 Tax=Sphingopyxis sp. TaxID=1908224 RepID=UPI002FCC81B3